MTCDPYNLTNQSYAADKHTNQVEDFIPDLPEDWKGDTIEPIHYNRSSEAIHLRKSKC